MAKGMTIGAVARETGVPVRTIRFYESEGVLPAAARTGSGYRMYSESDVRRLRMVRDARLLGLALPDARALVERAFSSDCATFAPELRAVIAARKAEVGCADQAAAVAAAGAGGSWSGTWSTRSARRRRGRRHRSAGSAR